MLLAFSLLVMAIGISSIAGLRVLHETQSLSNNTYHAQYQAKSALNYAVHLLNTEDNWRTIRPDGSWYDQVVLGNGGTISIDVQDEQGRLLKDHVGENIRIEVEGRQGESRYMLQAILASESLKIPAVNYPVHVEGNLTVAAGASMFVKGKGASSSGNILVSGAIEGNAQGKSINGKANIKGKKEVLNATLAPFDYSLVTLYENPDANIMISGSVFERTVLGPSEDQVDAKQMKYVYRLQLKSDLTIRNIRIQGTLYVKTNGFNLTLDEQVLLQPLTKGGISLIVDGDVTFSFRGGKHMLNEADYAYNFNPTRMAYLEQTDSDATDKHESQIEGIVLVNGNVHVEESSLFHGSVICLKNMHVADAPVFHYQNQVQNEAASLIGDNEIMKIVPGSIKQIYD
ncbi:hypothetical protein [Poriferisphaera sp. WC338]|uniref:hypothetical protein n=1 Tax=Poriferisphaera sp. WC338 TaxID=3425129 RepID=UPI003D81B35C